MKYNFNEIEAKWQKYWGEDQTFKAKNPSPSFGGGQGGAKKFYVLDMFPYPSGAGLHVGHPLGYIASDIYSRFKRHQGYNVLHPMGYDSFGLPAEQYAIQTGQHPAITTETNINRYREQLDKLGFSFDWSREVRTSEPSYYKWTQWIFIQLFNSWYNKDADKAEDISTLISRFEKEGNSAINAACDDDIPIFSAESWNAFSSEEKQQILLKYRLTYLAETEVNWCPALGTVLANDEIVNGVSERGGHPVIRKKMTQWSMRITAYAQRLLDGLEKIDWPQPLKDSQTYWIGRSEGAMVSFEVLPPTPSKGRGASPKYLTGNLEIANELLANAKSMRKKPTAAEAVLWDALRNRNLEDKFRRQHPIGNYIADFVCLEKKLVIEVDGKYHDDTQQDELDEERTWELEQKYGFKVLRFSNTQVLNEIKKVLNEIKEHIKNRELAPLSTGEGLGVRKIEVFTTRPDTIFGVSFLTLAPEHELVSQITTPQQKAQVEAYVEATAKRSERERLADVKSITGVFTGAYAKHPFTGKEIPVWIGDYVLAGYGTGAVMAVPCGDQRDYDFAKHFGLEIPNIFDLSHVEKSSPPLEGLGEAFTDKDKTIIANSDFLNGLNYKQATKKVIEKLEEIGAGKGKINYRMRDAVFSRQRYWGEPFPVYYVNGLPQMIDEKYLPLELPEVDKYLPTEDGAPPLGNAKNWYWDTKNNTVCPPPLEGTGEEGIYPLELNTMPGWAGSSWYFNRYMDAHNPNEFASKEALNYWQDVDLYIGGSEHATGHLLYSRFWQKFLFDHGYVPTDEYAKKLINQGMILGESAFINVFSGLYDIEYNQNVGEMRFVLEHAISEEDYWHFINQDYDKIDYTQFYKHRYQQEDTENYKFRRESISKINVRRVRVPIEFVNSSNILNIEMAEDWGSNIRFMDFKNRTYKVSREVEKMSKSKYNVVNPDDICEQYGADTLRLYEMFLGPLEQAKPWNTAGISGVFGFLKKLWKLYHSGPNDTFYVTGSPPLEGSGEDSGEDLKEALKSLHKTIKKVTEDIENFSFNTSVSQFMICVNELTALKCNHRAILEPLAIIISPYAPHIAEELWEKLGHRGSISKVPFPKFEEKYLVESEKEYPVSFNGKMRFNLKLPLSLTVAEVEKAVLADERTQQQLNGAMPKKVIVVPGKIVNIVI